MAKKKAPQARPSNNETRRVMLQYFYERNCNATSARGKKGSAVKISDVKRELKAAHGLTQQEVQSNLTYLISQGWVEEDTVEKSFTAPAGTVIPSSTSFFRITAAGIDKIEGPGEFTMPKFQGINIQATGAAEHDALRSRLQGQRSPIRRLPSYCLRLPSVFGQGRSSGTQP